MTGPGFGPVDVEVRATVAAAADALKGLGLHVEAVGIPALEKDFALHVFNRLHVMEMKPAFAEATAGRSPDELYKMAKTMRGLPDTSMSDYINAEQAAERIRDGYAEYFENFDVLLTHVRPIPAHKHGVAELLIGGQKVGATYLQGATVPLNLTGLPGISMRFGTSNAGMPINVQLVGSWLAEPTILHVASLLESVSTVRDPYPSLPLCAWRPRRDTLMLPPGIESTGARRAPTVRRRPGVGDGRIHLGRQPCFRSWVASQSWGTCACFPVTATFE